MLETSARLLQLLSLFQGRRLWSGAELSERLNVTVRTVRRDVDKLRALGYQIRSTSGVEGGYQFVPGSAMPPLLLADEEAVAVALGLGLAATGAVAGMEEASVTALAKIEQVLPVRLGRRVSALRSMIVTPPGAAFSVDARALTTIAGACRDQRMVAFRYRDYAGKASARSVEPHRLVHTGYRWYLVAWDPDRNDWRTFRVDRIHPNISTDKNFSPRQPPARDLVAYVTRGAAFAPPIQARARVFISAETLAGRIPFAAKHVERIDDESCYLNLRASSYESMAMHLVFLGVDFQVAEPPEFLHEIKRVAKRLRRGIK
ncbi:MAG TPA: YafY family protein [Bryobacteraceae bacterium]|nr:YafY family protein [Bryobacteraceae bacterium]